MKYFVAKFSKGYSLVELIIYVAILSFVSLLIVNTLLSFGSGYRTVRILHFIDSSGVSGMERMTRDLRSANTVDTANSTFGGTSGVLTITATQNSISTTTKFYLQNGILKADVNGVYLGPLSDSRATVTSLTFNKIDSSVSSAIKIDMTVSASVGSITKTKKYHSTIILKGQ